MTLDTLWKLALIAIVGWVIWKLLQPRTAFVVQVMSGTPQATKGTVTPAFLDEVRQVCERNGVTSGFVRGLIRGGRISLACSREFPPEAQQQLRNWWAMSGWSPSKANRGRLTPK